MFKSRLTRGRHAHIKFLGSIAVSGFAAVLIVVSAEVTILGAGVSAASPAATSPPRRIGQTPLVTARAVSLGALAGTTAMRVDVELLPRDPAALANFATAVSTPGNPLYKHYITTFEFASTFGPTAAAISAVTNELESDGLQLGPITANHLTIPVTGASSQFEKAFSIGFDRYQFAGRVAYANTQAPLVSGNVAPYVLGVVGLNNLYLPHRLGLQTPRGTVTGAARPQVVTGGPQPCATAVDDAPEWDAYTADQLASAYGFSSLYGAGDEGSGVTVAIFELEPNLTSDIEAYQSCYGTSTTVNYIKEDGGTGTGAGEGEAALDIEDVIGLAPKATIDVYQAPNTNTGLIDNYTAIVTSGAQVVSTSWGLCEAESGSTVPSEEATLFQESATEGQSVFAAAGDSGSSDCETSSLAVDDPASQPYVTGVGGTSLTALGPPPTETVWNESSNDAGAGGGGISSLYTMPSYQSSAPASLNVLNTNSSGTPCGAAPGSYCREVPDVSADADPYTGYLIYYDGGWTGIGGTSAAAPLWAAYTALADGSSACVGKRVGFANPALYDAAGSSYSSDFHDITSGNDRYTPDGYTGGLYPTGTGYDMASGLGTPNGGPLASTLCDEANPAHTVSVTNPGSQTSTVGTAVSLQITATDSASGQTLTYSATGLPAGLSISSSSGLISGTPTTATSYSVTVTAKDTTSASGSASFTWTVNPAAHTVSVTNPGSQTSTVGTAVSLQITATDSASGQTLTYSATGLPAGLSISSSSGLISGTPTTATSYSVTVTAKDTTSASGSASFTWTVNPAAHTVSVTNPGSQTSTVGTAVSLQITATDSASGQTLTYSATGLPAGLSISSSSGLISGTPTTATSYSVTVTAKDTTSASGSASFTWTVNPAAHTVSVTNPGSQTSTVGTAVSLQITATDSASGQTLTYSATGLPAGLSISSSSGLISGTPTTATSYSVTVTAKDTTSASGSASFTWTVNPARPTLTTTPRPTSVTLGKTAPTLKDSAILSGGYNPTGRVTFTLYYDGAANPVYTSPAVGLSKGSASASYTLRRTSVQFAGMYQWDATYSGDANNDSASDINDPAEVVTVTAPGELAFGGGWYTPSASVGKASFGFVVAQGPSSTYTGQLNDVTPGKWWFQAKVTSFGLTGRTRRLLAGTGSLYSWNSTLNKGHGGWQLVRSGVTYKATADAGTNSAASFGIKISYTLTPERTALPNSSPIALTRGRIFISLIPSSDAERSGIPDHPVE